MNRFRIVVACALAVLLGAGAVHAQPDATRISVLPLSNSGDRNADYFADAMTDEIAVALTKVPGVGVVGRSSVYIPRLPGQATCPQRPDAEYLVSGSANRVGQNIRISVRLERQNCSGTSAPLWQADYERNSNDLFDIEEDIALHVAEAVGRPVRLARGVHLLKSRAKDMEAYDQYLHAKVLARGRGAQALGDASKLLEQVLARDPDFEPAAAMIAYEYALTPLFAPPLRSGHPDEERKITDRLLPRAEAFALRAVALDPKDATAFVGLGYVRLVQRKMIAAEDAFKEALRLDPNQADGLHGYSQFLAAMGKIRESLAMRAHLQDIEPSIINYTADTAEIYWLAGDTDKAIATLQPFRPGRTMELALIESASGRYHDAAALLREMPQTNWPDGLLEKAAKLLDTAPAQMPPDSLPGLGSLSFAFLHVGAPERVLEYYEDEVKGGYFQPISATWFWHPSYAVVRKTERFKRLARDLGMVEYWRARGWPQWCHPAGANDFACE
jgi:TolB-like protein